MIGTARATDQRLSAGSQDGQANCARLSRRRCNGEIGQIDCRPPIPSFSIGRTALVGDAAHPMVPFLAQGAAQAIEDAGALGRRSASVRDIPVALAMYSRDRVTRASRVQREAHKQGRIYHLNGVSAFARDMTMRMFAPHWLIARYDWLYGA